jgi:hypothetical protein
MVVEDDQQYIRSFFVIRDGHIKDAVDQHLSQGALWPDPLLQLHPDMLDLPSRW